jgi:putative aldouronate transport system substrate-binding protein
VHAYLRDNEQSKIFFWRLRMKRMRTAIALLVFLAVGTGLVFAAGGSEASTTDVPEVWIWPTMALSDPNGSNPDKLAEMQDYIIDQVGVKPMAYVPPASDAQTKLNLTLGSANQRLDVFQGNWSDYKDIAIPINDLLDQYGPNVRKAFSQDQWAGVTDKDGNIWGVPRLGVMGHTNPTWFNNKMLKDLGLSLPQTLEEAVQTFEKIRVAIPDAVILIHNLAQLQRGLAGGFTEYGYSRWPGSDGKLNAPEFQPGYRDFIAAMADWYKKGYIFKESFIQHDNIEVLKTGKVAIFVGWYSQITIHFQRVLLTGEYPGLTYSHPDGFTSAHGLVMTNNASPYAATMISKKSPNPEAAMRLLNWQYDTGKDNVLTAAYGIKGQAWDWVDPSNKYYVDRFETEAGRIYAGEFMIATGLGTDLWYAPNTEDLKKHYEEIRDYAVNYANGKHPYDFDVAYDMAIIKDNVASYDDIARMIEEETIKFISGNRPMSQWDSFLDSLKKIGIDQLNDEYTKQYNEIKGK